MQTWWYDSPYWWANIYIGGANVAGCNTGLSFAWVATVARQGWGLVPTWAGYQAPCLSQDYVMSSNPSTANSQGFQTARNAVSAAEGFGIGPGAVIYLDLEYYNPGNPACAAAAVQAYASGWDQQLAGAGYVSGIYTSASDVTQFAAISWTPADIWPGGGGFWGSSYSANATVWGNAYFPDGLWVLDQRLYQYTSGHYENYSGVNLHIDSDCGMGATAPASGGDTYDESNEGASPQYDQYCRA